MINKYLKALRTLIFMITRIEHLFINLQCDPKHIYSEIKFHLILVVDKYFFSS